MDTFSISQLAEFSGVKAHTIRMWEQRYTALKPSRSGGNTRSYDGVQLKRLLNIVSLSNDNFKVSSLCEMPDDKLNALIAERFITADKSNASVFVSQLISAGMEYSEPAFEKIFSHCLLHYGVSKAYKEVVYPLLKRLGLLWASSQLPPAHEHFITNIIRQKMLTAIDSLPLPGAGSRSWLLCLPENEFHEIGLLFAHYEIRKSGDTVFYLGANVPFQSLASAMQSINPDALLLFFVRHNNPETVQEYLEKLKKKHGSKHIYISGNPAFIGRLRLGESITWLKEVDDLQNIL